MIKRLVDFALDQRLVTIAAVLLLVVIGVYAYREVPVEAFPDVDDVQTQVITLWPGQAAEEVESQVTKPLEQQLNSLPGKTGLRSISMFGLSVITATFQDGTPDELARAQTFQLMQGVTLPTGANPQLQPLTTSTGEIFRYIIRAPVGMPLAEQRAIEDWVVEPAIRQVDGVGDVNAFGGGVKQYQVTVRPDALRQHGVTLAQVTTAVTNNNANTGADVLRTGEQMLVIRGVGLLASLDDIRRIWITSQAGHPVYLGDVADVGTGVAPRQGVVAYYQKAGVEGPAQQLDDVVEAIVLNRKGTNALHVIEGLRAKVEQLNDHILPPGVKLQVIYDRTDLVETTVHTVIHNLVEGAILILVISLLFTSSLRAAVIIGTIIPLSMLSAYIVLWAYDVPANLLSFGAVDFGILVDAAVVIVEAILVAKLTSPPDASTRDLSRHEATRLGRPMLFSKMIFIVALVPIFTFQHVEGRIFRPMALTITGAMVGAILLTLTLTPLMSSWLLAGAKGAGDNWLSRPLKRWYGRMMTFAVGRRARWAFLSGAVALLIAALLLGTQLGTEFIPTLDEGNIWLTVTMPLSVSKERAKENERQVRNILASYPEARLMYTQLGRPDDGTDAKGFNNIEVAVYLPPHDQWTTKGPDGKVVDKDGLIKLMGDELNRLPGLDFDFSQYIQDNVDEALSGVKGELAIKLFGDDLTVLQKKGQEVRDVIAAVPGSADVGLDQLSGQPNLTVRLDRSALARYGVDVATAEAYVQTGLGGQAAGSFLEGQRKFDISVRFAENARSTTGRIEDVWVDTPAGQRVPLGQLAHVEREDGASQIRRDENSRRIAIRCGIRGRDQGSFVAEAQRQVAEKVQLPPGYHITWEGQFENQRRATARLAVIVPLSLLGVIILLFWAFQRLRYALLIVASIPFSFVGSILLLWLTGTHLSVSAMIGFIALSGVSVQVGIVLVGQFNQLRVHGMPLEQAVVVGSQNRLRPVLMTALMAAIGLAPAAFSHGIGSEVQRPLALVIVGGMISSALLILTVLPLMYEAVERAFPAPVHVPEGLVE
jgi:cobalt-zinc-cadmium resistance protein CzcA